jgi:hypothetical protein
VIGPTLDRRPTRKLAHVSAESMPSTATVACAGQPSQSLRRLVARA